MSIGLWQLVLILLIVFVIFGAGKLPKVMGDFGKGVKNLKKGLNEDDAPDANNKALDEPKKPATKSPAKKTTAAKKAPAKKAAPAKKTVAKKPATKKPAAKKAPAKKTSTKKATTTKSTKAPKKTTKS